MLIENLYQSTSEQGCFWPFDLLAHESDFRTRIRILTYGYNSHLTGGYRSLTNEMNISQHGTNLLNAVTHCRTPCKTRPLIFVAHSLGGILVKEAIIQSEKFKRYQGHSHQRVADLCQAIFFFGTPHRGSDLAELGTFLSNVSGSIPGGPTVYTGILQELRTDSQILETLETDFNSFLDLATKAPRGLKICSFREGARKNRVNGLSKKVSNCTLQSKNLQLICRRWLVISLQVWPVGPSRPSFGLKQITRKCADSNRL